MPAPKMLAGLPKPLLFGLYGAAAGLLGALVFGEPLWRLLQPPPAPAAEPQLAVSASATVQVYPNSENTFAVKVARGGFDTPAVVKFGGLPSGITIPPVTVPAGKTETTATVSTDPDVLPGEYTVTLAAAGEVGSPAAAGEFKVVVVPPPPPPPALALAVPPNLGVYKKGTGKFVTSIDRREYDGPVTVRVEGLPAGVTADPVTIPAGRKEAEVTLKTADDAAIGEAKLTVVAEAVAAKLKASAPTAVAVLPPPTAPADVVFVLDVTASMQWAIDDLKNGIGKFADTLAKNQINFRLGLVTFRDLTREGEGVDVVKFKGQEFTNDAALFRERTGTIRASGGGDVPESSLEAVAEAAKLPFRQGATRVLLLLTDAPPKVPGGNVAKAVEDAAGVVKDKGIDAVHLVIDRQDVNTYKPLMAAGADKAGGKYFNLGDVVRGDEGFDSLLDTFGKAVAAAAIARAPEGKAVVAPAPEPPRLAAAAAATPKSAEAAPAPAVKSLQGDERSAAGSEGQLVLRSGVWTGAIAALVCLALLSGQHHYLRGSLPGAGGLAAGFLGGLVVGLVGGAAGQGLYFLAPQSEALGQLFRVLGWTLLGGLAGLGLSPFIPNMKWTHGLAGGAVGGAVGAVGFIAVSAVVGDLLGRLAGGLLLGFCIGLMVAVVEAAFRRAWLEVRFGARETIAVNLGPEPVKVGGDARACTVWARGAAPVALRFFLRDGKVVCDDPVMRREAAVADGFSKEVGNVTVTVRTGSGAAAAPPVPPRPAPRRPAEDDDFDLPMPVSAAAAPARAPAPKPAAAPLSLDDDPAPAPKPAAPAPKPVAPPTASKPAMPAVPPRPPTPAASKPAMPPVPPKPAAPAPRPPAPKPAAPAAAGPKHPDACPSCGRVNAGRPKQRYCMVCDQTY